MKDLPKFVGLTPKGYVWLLNYGKPQMEHVEEIYEKYEFQINEWYRQNYGKPQKEALRKLEQIINGN